MHITLTSIMTSFCLTLICHLSSPSLLRSNPFYEPRTSSPTHPPAGGPSLDMSSSQKRRAPPPPSSSPGLGPSPPAPKPSSIPDRERAQPVGPSPVAAVRELASSSPKVTRHTDTCDNKTKHVINASLKYSLCSVLLNLKQPLFKAWGRC